MVRPKTPKGTLPKQTDILLDTKVIDMTTEVEVPNEFLRALGSTPRYVGFGLKNAKLKPKGKP